MEKTTLNEMLEQSKKIHLEICAVISALQKQGDSPYGYKLVWLKQFRLQTLKSQKLDKKIRAVTVEKSKEILKSNSEKIRSKRESSNSDAQA